MSSSLIVSIYRKQSMITFYLCQVEVKIPRLMVRMESGDLGVGYIPGDIVLLTLTVLVSCVGSL